MPSKAKTPHVPRTASELETILVAIFDTEPPLDALRSVLVGEVLLLDHADTAAMLGHLRDLRRRHETRTRTS